MKMVVCVHAVGYGNGTVPPESGPPLHPVRLMVAPMMAGMVHFQFRLDAAAPMLRT